MKNYARSFRKKSLTAYRTPSSFQAKVYSVVKQIPKGKTLTYKEVAIKIGSPKAYRAVGNALNKNFDKKIPCHRVVRSDGANGGYNRGAQLKAEILKIEGYRKDKH
jgi:O-6-methylguanine DNA methyltransferase